MKLRLGLMIVPLMLLLLVPFGAGQNLPASPGSGQPVLVPLPADLNGQLNGVPYRIRVPANWNGTLLVYAYGYAEGYDPPLLAPMAPPMPDLDAQMLLARGFALAGVFASGAVHSPGIQAWAGYNMKQRIQETAALTAAFRGIVGQPKRTIVWGKSMGGLEAIALIEKYPGLYDGAVPLCAPGAGTPRMFDQKLDILLAYAVAFGWNDAWGTPDNIRPDLNFFTEVAPQIAANLTDENKWRWEFFRLVNRIPADQSFYGSAPPFLYQELWLAFVPTADLNSRAGGRVNQNAGRTYWLRDQDWTELLNEFPNKDPKTLRDDVDALLQQMNLSAIYHSDVNARNYAEHYYEPTGRITRPVITLHTTGDAAVIPNNEDVYLKLVQGQGKTDLLMQEFTTGLPNMNTHCTFSPLQYFAAIDAMVQWIDTGSKPNPADFFTEDLGFDTDYVPDEWPW